MQANVETASYPEVLAKGIDEYTTLMDNYTDFPCRLNRPTGRRCHHGTHRSQCVALKLQRAR